MGVLLAQNRPPVSAFPDSTFASAAHRPFRGLLGVHSRCGAHTCAVTKDVTAIRGLQTFRRLHACPGCSRLERVAGGACTRWKCAAFHGARGLRTFAYPSATRRGSSSTSPANGGAHSSG